MKKCIKIKICLKLEMIRDALEHFVNWKQQFDDNYETIEDGIHTFGHKSYKEKFKYQEYENLLTKMKG